MEPGLIILRVSETTGAVVTEIDEETLRDQLKTKRNSLQQEFQMNPSNARLALEIRLIDDLTASLSKYLQTQKARSASTQLASLRN